MSDTYVGIMDFWPEVGEHCDRKIAFDSGRGFFVAKVEEEHFVSSETLSGVKEKIDRALSFQEKAKREKLTPVKVVRVHKANILGRNSDEDLLEDVEIVALHAGNGNAVIKTSKGKKEQVSWGYSEFLKPMTDEEKAEYQRLDKARRLADKEFEEHLARFLIRGKVGEYAREVWKLPKGE